MTTSTRPAADQMARSFAAIDARDLDSLSQLWHEATTDVFHALDLVLVGRDAIRPFFDEFFTALPDLSFETDAVHGVGDRIAVGQWHLTGTFTGGPFQGIEPTGHAIDLRGVDVMRFDDAGQLDHNDIYYDGLTFARQVGLLPASGSRADHGLTAAFNALTRTRRAVRERLSD